MDFFGEIAHNIYTRQTKIGDTVFGTYEYIEAMHEKAEFKGRVFYANLIHAMPNHWGADAMNKLFKEILAYCKNQMDTYPPSPDIARKNILFAHRVDPINFCGKNIGGIFYGTSLRTPFRTKPTKGAIHDYETCKGCKKARQIIINRLTPYIDKFPNCCTEHQRLIPEKWFDRADYINTPEMLADKIIYTKQHYLNNLEGENWYNEITDYIEYTIFSFGEFPKGYGGALCLSEYVRYIKSYIESIEVTGREIERKKAIIEYINALNKEPKKEDKREGKKEKGDTDLNVLIATYEKWLNLFPFELSFFRELKPKFEKLPLFNGKPEYNKYLDTHRAKLHTKASLVSALINLTNKLLTEINTENLFQRGLLTDADKIKLELIIQERRMGLKQGYHSQAKEEGQQYRGMLKKWFADEKRFIDDIKPLLSLMPPPATDEQKPATNAPETEIETFDPLISALIDYGFYNLDKVKSLSDSQQNGLVNLIKRRKLPYVIALFDFLGFLKYLEQNHFTTKYKLNKELAKMLNSSKDGRAVKGNISSLSQHTTENKTRYTAYQYKKTVETDYHNLK